MSFTEILIGEVKKHKQLFDFKHPDYKNSRKRDLIWNTMGKRLGEDGEELKKKWKNIRDCYQKHLKSLNELYQVKRSYKNWQWSQQMEFCKPFLTITSSEPNTYESENNGELQSQTRTPMSPCTPELSLKIEFDDSTLEINQPGSVQDTSEENIKKEVDVEASDPLGQYTEHFKETEMQNKRKRKWEKFPEEHRTSSVDQIVEYSNYKQQYIDGLDAIELIFLGYARTIKSFSRKRQAIAKMRVAKIIMEEEIAHLEETTNLPTGTYDNFSRHFSNINTADNLH